MKTLSLLGKWPELIENASDIRNNSTSSRLTPTRIDLPRASTTIQYVKDGAGARELIESLLAVPLTAIAFDSEYSYSQEGISLQSGNKWYDNQTQHPICVSLVAWALDYENREDGYIIRAVLDVRDQEVVDILDEILRMRALSVFHNVKAELFTFWALGLDPDLPNLYDTFLAAACLNLGLNHKRSLGLQSQNEAEQIRSEAELNRKKQHVLSLVGQCEHYGLYYPFSEGKSEQQESFLNFDDDSPLNERNIEYASADAEWTLRLYAAQHQDVLLSGLYSHLYNVEFPFALANARMEWRGVPVDPKGREKLKQATQNASEYYKEVLRGYGIDPPGSRDQFLRFMQSIGLKEHFRRNGKHSTEKEFLESREELHPAVRAFRLHRQYQRTASEEWLLGGLNGADGRMHPKHRQLGAATGRNTCTMPNIAGIGRVLRPVVTAPPGKAILELDYSQVEVGVAAAEHNDEGLITAYNSGDVYAAMAQLFYAERLTQEDRSLPAKEFKKCHPDLRDAMKTFVLAVIYNIQAEGIAARFGIPKNEAESERARFLDLYPTLTHRLTESATFGSIRGYASVISGLRRRRERGKKADTWTKNFLRNTPIQGSAAVVFKHAMVLLDQEFRFTDTWLILPVHDAIVIECPANQVEEVAERARILMQLALKSYYPKLTPKVDINKSHPECWNKDGHADSLEKFLKDPTFKINKAPFEVLQGV